MKRRSFVAPILAVAALLVFGAISGVGTVSAQPPSKAHLFPKATQLPKLAVGQHYGRQVVMTPNGPVTIEYGDEPTVATGAAAQSNGAAAAASTIRVRSCYASATGATWKIRVDSTFQYNYTTLWQQPPRLSIWNVLPYSWSHLSAWNSYWTYTVRFADAQGVLSVGVWGVGLAVTYNLSIQEDAWGNCRPNVWRS